MFFFLSLISALFAASPLRHILYFRIFFPPPSATDYFREVERITRCSCDEETCRETPQLSPTQHHDLRFILLLDMMVKSRWLTVEPFMLIWNFIAVWSHKFTNHLIENGKRFLNFYTFSVSQVANDFFGPLRQSRAYKLQYEQDISAVIQQMKIKWWRGAL